MIRLRLRAVLLLFLVLHLTACYTWQGVATTSPAGLIEATQPDRIRVNGGSVLEREVEAPSVEGDQLLGANGVSLPLEDILRVEVRSFSLGRTVLALLGIYSALFLGLWLQCAIEDCQL